MTMRTRLLGVLFLAALPGACKNTVVPPDFLASAKISPTSFHVGDTALITITYTNESDITEPFDWTDCPDQWMAQTGGVVWAPSQAGACTLLIGSADLDPGKQQSFTYQWTGTTRGDTTGLPSTLPPGAYTLQARPQATMNVHLNFHLAPAVSFQILP